MAASSHELYPVYNAMIARCHLITNPWYPEYGGRGIKVCEQWRKDFYCFVEDMGPRPLNHTLERLENELGYYKENCAWVTQSEQNKNQRRRKTAISDQIILEIFYSPFPVMMLARKYDVDKRTIYSIKNKTNGIYATDLCNKYKLINGIITLKS